MKVMPWAEFTGDVLYDAIETADGRDFIQWPGKAAAEELMIMLIRSGYGVTPLICLEHAGWEFVIDACDRNVRCRVTYIEKCLVVFSDDSWFSKLLNSSAHPTFVKLLKRIGEAMANDPRFHDVRWFSDDEVLEDKEGSISPVSD